VHRGARYHPPRVPTKPPKIAELKRLRARMDRLNAHLVARLQERARLVERIVALKHDLGMPAVDAPREREMLERTLRAAPRGFAPRELRRVLRCVFRTSRALAVQRARGLDRH
jgi:chorismate mutase